jgi:hypothetical protein
MKQIKTEEERARLDIIFAEIEAERTTNERPDNGRTQVQIDEANRKSKIDKLANLERKEFIGNVKSIIGNDGFKTKWEKILAKFILNSIAPMNEELNLLRNFTTSVSQRLENAERSAKEQDNHHYYKIFAEGVKTLLEKL